MYDYGAIQRQISKSINVVLALSTLALTVSEMSTFERFNLQNAIMEYNIRNSMENVEVSESHMSFSFPIALIVSTILTFKIVDDEKLGQDHGEYSIHNCVNP